MIKNKVDKEYEQDRVDRLNSALDYVRSILRDESHSIDEAVLIASKRFDIEPKDIWEDI